MIESGCRPLDGKCLPGFNRDASPLFVLAVILNKGIGAWAADLPRFQPPAALFQRMVVGAPLVERFLPKVDPVFSAGPVLSPLCHQLIVGDDFPWYLRLINLHQQNKPHQRPDEHDTTS